MTNLTTTNLFLFTLFLFVCVALPLLLYSSHVVNYFRERRRRREFGDFEKSLVGEQDGKKFFSGDVKLEEEVTVMVPELAESENDFKKVVDAVVAAFKPGETGEVLRVFPIGNGCGIDVMLFDFVNGVALLRSTLVREGVPEGTLIEYSGGDLMIYEA